MEYSDGSTPHGGRLASFNQGAPHRQSVVLEDPRWVTLTSQTGTALVRPVAPGSLGPYDYSYCVRSTTPVRYTV